MDNLSKRQKDMYQGLWFATIILIILLLIIWFYPSIGIDSDKKLYLTILAIIGIPLGWFFFYRQKRIDLGKIAQKENFGEDLYKATNIAQGVSFRWYSIKYGLIGTIFLIVGIYFLLSNDPYFPWWGGLILAIIGSVLVPIAVKNFWKMGGQKMKGRYY